MHLFQKQITACVMSLIREEPKMVPAGMFNSMPVTFPANTTMPPGTVVTQQPQTVVPAVGTYLPQMATHPPYMHYAPPPYGNATCSYTGSMPMHSTAARGQPCGDCAACRSRRPG